MECVVASAKEEVLKPEKAIAEACPTGEKAAPRKRRPVFGVLLTVLGTASWSYVNLLVHVNEVFDSAWMNGFIVLIYTIFNFPLVFLHRRLGGKPFSQLSAKVAIASTASATATFAGYAVIFVAMKLCPLGDTVSLYSLNVIWTPLMESSLKKKFPKKQQILSLLIAMVGVTLLTRPSFIFGAPYEEFIKNYPDYKQGYLYSLLASFCFAASEILVGHFEEVHWTVWQLASTPAGFISVPVFMHICNGFSLPSRAAFISFLDILNGILVGILDLSARMLVIFAIQEDSATTTAISETSEIPFSYFLGLVFLKETPSLLSAGGALLICSAMFMLANAPLKLWTYLKKTKKPP